MFHRTRLALPLFFLSGLSSLVYELVWLRVAAQSVGNTTYAIGTVVAIFMGGLALGSWGGGKIARESKQPLRFYGLLEGGIALLSIGPLYVLRAFGSLWACLILLPPTFLMGATFPVFAHFISQDSKTPSREIGSAYAVNTLGGVAGCLLAAFCLLPFIGIMKTNFIAVGINLVVALMVFRLSSSSPSPLPLPHQGGGESNNGSPLKGKGKFQSNPPSLDGRGPGGGWQSNLMLWLAAGLAGFASLVCETAWTKSLILSFGSTVYAFGLVLAAFLLGLAVGAVLITRIFRRIGNPLNTTAWLQIFTAGTLLLLLPFLGDLPVTITQWIRPDKLSLSGLFVLQAGLSLLFVFLPATLIGTALPLFFRIGIPSGEERGSRAGLLYAVNTVGAIAGSLASAFLFIPKMGLSQTIITASGLNLGVALLLRGLKRWPSAILITALWIGAVALLPPWDINLVASGGYLRYVSGKQSGVQLVDHFWDSYGLVTIHQFADHSLALRINGKTDASTNPKDMNTQFLLGHIPMITASGEHPPEEVFILGFGAGGTLSAVERHPVKKIVMAEISPGVVAASRYFKEADRDALGDSRVELNVTDGRKLLQGQRRAYDVIISEPSNLWVSGMANLFTREFFMTAKRRLKPDGLMGQWLHAYALSTADFKSVIRTFYSVFPHGEVWELLLGNDYLLIGRQAPFDPSKSPLPGGEGVRGRVATPTLALPPQGGGDRFQDLFETFIGKDLQFAEIENFENLSRLALMTAEEARSFAGDGPLLTDDLNRVDYTAPIAMLEGPSPDWWGFLRKRDRLLSAPPSPK